MVGSWCATGKIEIGGEALPASLTADQKYSILRLYFASTRFDAEAKIALKS